LSVKEQKKREIARYRKLLKTLYHWQVHVKYLNDIPHIYALVLRGILPKFEYTIKDVLTGTTFISYAHKLSTFNSARFIALCLDHFRSYGLDLSQITIQTDNGSEFIGSITAKKDSLVTRVVEKTFGARHVTIPPATPRFNGSVENFHGRIEDEFYDLEDLLNLSDLLGKALTYMLYFNLERPNLNLKKTPLEAVQQQTEIKDPQFMVFPPLLLDQLPLFGPQLRSVNDVSDEVTGPSTPCSPVAPVVKVTPCDTEGALCNHIPAIHILGAPTAALTPGVPLSLVRQTAQSQILPADVSSSYSMKVKSGSKSGQNEVRSGADLSKMAANSP